MSLIKTPFTPRPIETPYAGRLFRSRLEARWAVFYEAIGVPWVYEPEGFQLADDVRYLPDFWLPQQQCYIEIKPTEPSDIELRKAELLARHTGRRVLIFVGQPGYHHDDGYPPGQITSDGAYLFHDGGDESYAWCVCPCGRFGIEYMGRSERVCRHDPAANKCYSYDDPRVLTAYDRANRARFAAEGGRC